MTRILVHVGFLLLFVGKLQATSTPEDDGVCHKEECQQQEQQPDRSLIQFRVDRKLARDKAIADQKHSALQIFAHLRKNHCEAACRNSPKPEECTTSCRASVDRVRLASDNIHPGIEEMIQYPPTDVMKSLRRSADGSPFDGMMFPSGAVFNGISTFMARVCTHKCIHMTPAIDSTIIIGELEADASKSPTLQKNWSWKHAQELSVSHDDFFANGWFGPEDPRLDIIGGSRFATVNMYVDGKKYPGCKRTGMGPRHVFFIPIDASAGPSRCELQLDGVDQCSWQKNFPSLVTEGSKDIFFQFSPRPLQIFRLKPATCKTEWLDLPNDVRVGNWKSSERPFSVDLEIHGGTRYLSGGRVQGGEIFWSLAHTGDTRLRTPVVVGVLHRHPEEVTPEKPVFQIVGISCPVNISAPFNMWDPTLMLMPTSLIDYDKDADLAMITFHVQDQKNFRSQLLGVGKWLKVIHEEFLKGMSFSCHQGQGPSASPLSFRTF